MKRKVYNVPEIDHIPVTGICAHMGDSVVQLISDIRINMDEISFVRLESGS